ncbi:hypothetical protein NADFUDRAFT_58794 [Nadsonia fulvescens var. elongata DSM 6958]|uniref:SUN-domain-containing protein n=1 Tax=Nadsonia fulvescens var. elongata DSM 6958 TaxID=857566 RepID=A0A1E3PKX1_9ASCO|nr:hypothetical protein NADFUDRAFT_58794 [Nadsonia fulvescens var. elongata DSM 6958]
MFSQSTIIAILAATSVLSVQGAEVHRHHKHDLFNEHADTGVKLAERGNTCSFPSDAGLVSVTSDSLNGGFAMSPDQACTAGSWCPYACPPGQVSVQWDPSVTSYSYPGSQYGGLYCNANGELEKPYDDRPYCQDGTGFAKARNSASQQVAFCQTVLPGNEAMLIPTNVEADSDVTLAVPDPSYWAGTAAHYYINAPGYDIDTACVWGTKDKPYGNWSPYVGGVNTDSSGKTYVKIGWNPVYLEEATPFRNELPTFGVRVVCDDGSCNGTPCEIDPSKVGVNGITGSGSSGAGGGAFCVVTAPKGVTAHIEVFETGSSSSKREVLAEREVEVEDSAMSTKTIIHTVTSAMVSIVPTSESLNNSSEVSSVELSYRPSSSFSYIAAAVTPLQATNSTTLSNTTGSLTQIEQISGSAKTGASLAAIFAAFFVSALFA